MTRPPESSRQPINPHMELLLGPLYGALAGDHRADLRKSGLTEDTITAQHIRAVPPSMIPRLLGFEAPRVVSAYLIPFADPHGGWMDHVRMKVFPSITTDKGTIKYLQPRQSGNRVFFPVTTLPRVVASADEPLWLCEGEKKALAVAQRGRPAIGFCGIQGWHIRGSRSLLRDFDLIPLVGRVVELVPDGDVQTNPTVAKGATDFAQALTERGAVVRLVELPHGVSA